MKLNLNPLIGWAIEPSAYHALARRAAQLELSPQLYDEDDEIETAPVATASENQGAVAIVPFYGPIISGASRFMERYYGCVNPERMALTISRLAADAQVKAIVIDADTPGGTVSGCEDVFEAVQRAVLKKPVHVYVRSMLCSGGVFTLAPATSITARPAGSLVGSIGVVINHMEYSKALEQFGLTPTKVVSTPLKQSSSPEHPLSPEGEAELQRIVDATHEHFLEAVTTGYGVPRQTAEGWATGQVWIGSEAHALGLVHHLGGMADVLERVSSSLKSGPKAKATSKGVKMKDILAKLNLSEDASEADVVARIGQLQTRAAAYLELTGADNHEAAYGVVNGWKGAAARLPGVESELATVKGDQEKTKFEALVTQGLSDGKLTPAMVEGFRGSPVLGTSAALEGFLAVAPKVVNANVATPPAPDGGTPPAAGAELKHNGKTWAQMSGDEKHNLWVSDKALYTQMRDAAKN